MPLTGPNTGRLINFVNGITGVAAGGNAQLNLATNQRYHAIVFQCAAVNYTGGTGKNISKVTGSGTGGTATLTIVNGSVTAAAVVSGGSGYTTGDIVTVADATGTGQTFTVTASAGAITALAVNAGTATASPINPATLITSMRILVNGVNIRDITPQYSLMIANANGIYPLLGELPVFFTEPNMNILARANTSTSWDMFGQATFQMQFTVAAGYQLPSVTASQEFDYQRNALSDAKGNAVPYLEPVSQHSYNINAAAGLNTINYLPYSYPIRRIWVIGATPGNITQLEVYQDSNKILEATTAQIKQQYGDYGFKFGQDTSYLNSNQTAQNTLGLNPVTYFDTAFIADKDNRFSESLKCANSFNLRIYSAIAQNITVVMETLPGAYAS